MKFYEMSSTGAGDTLVVETDVTILSDYINVDVAVTNQTAMQQMGLRYLA